jgi:hypothetical protein
MAEDLTYMETRFTGGKITVDSSSQACQVVSLSKEKKNSQNKKSYQEE